MLTAPLLRLVVFQGLFQFSPAQFAEFLVRPIRTRADGAGFHFLGVGPMVILELACLVVQGSKTAFEIQVRYRFPAEGLFCYVKFVHGHDDNHIGTAGFSYGLKAGFGEQVVLLLQGDFPYTSLSTMS